jgi:hypothetical protein
LVHVYVTGRCRVTCFYQRACFLKASPAYWKNDCVSRSANARFGR